MKYFHREDLPDNMWGWMPLEEVKAIAGFSVVPKNKRNGEFQRKLIMCCSLNYLWESVEKRSNQGMDGAGALARIHTEGQPLDVSACDQSNAFTRVLVPEWFHAYQAVPPICANEVWELIPQTLRGTLCRSDMVCPVYKRLPMGSSHSVHILMAINLQIIGRTLRRTLQFAVQNQPQAQQRHEELHTPLERLNSVANESGRYYGISDLEWWKLHNTAERVRNEAGYSVQEWWEAITQARISGSRTIVVMSFFSGERRCGDIHHFVEQQAKAADIPILMISIDLAVDARWDLANDETFHSIMKMTRGFVDIVIGGPPCSTVSRARFNRTHQGPRPVRFRWCIWGRPDLTTAEKSRVDEANKLWINYMAVCESVSGQGGAHLWEHPKDPGQDPYPSIFATSEFCEFERRTDAVRVDFDQCVLGAPVPKGTTLSGNLKGIERFTAYQCPGVSEEHVHTGTRWAEMRQVIFVHVVFKPILRECANRLLCALLRPHVT